MDFLWISYGFPMDPMVILTSPEGNQVPYLKSIGHPGGPSSNMVSRAFYAIQ